MDLRTLKHVAILARTLNFTKAAEELGISQPALSRSIQAVERNERISLFDRDKGGVHLTVTGQAFATRASAILAEVEGLRQLARKSAAGVEGKLSFGMGPLPASVLLPSALNECMKAAPDLDINVNVHSADALFSLLEAEQIEFFIYAGGHCPKPAIVQADVLGLFPMGVLVRADHPLLSTAQSEIGKYPLMLAARVSGLPLMPAWLKPHLREGGNMIVEDSAVLSDLAERSDGIWVTTPFQAQEAIEQGRLRELPLGPGEQETTLQMMIHSLARRSLSPAATQMIERFRNKLSDLWRRTALLPNS
ncbi:LysR family transcriptional regulator [Rhizorhabdus argentea]|uniref:LysR family transcriptional regulator n=1 Tax=Rhizorhabdus argentea TaxID=1387174 RepID=UPI0030EB3F35